MGAFLLMSFTYEDKAFLVIYTICGITDVLDGFVARKFNITSELGSKLDSVSDLVFYSMMMYKVWGRLVDILPQILWNLIWTVVGIRICSYTYAALRFKALASEHTILNKISGLLVFLIPYFLNSDYFIYYAILVITVTLIAAIYEFILHLKKQ